MSIKITQSAAAAVAQSLASTINDGEYHLQVFGGTVPDNADRESSPDLLCTILLDGLSPLVMAVSGASLQMPGGAVWTGNVTTPGNPTHYRIVPVQSTGEEYVDEVRIQGTAGPTGSLTMRPTLYSGDPLTVTSFYISVPTGN